MQSIMTRDVHLITEANAIHISRHGLEQWSSQIFFFFFNGSRTDRAKSIGEPLLPQSIKLHPVINSMSLSICHPRCNTKGAIILYHLPVKFVTRTR